MMLLVIKSSAILLASWGVVQLLRRQPAAVRHLIWAAGVTGALAVPALTLLLPSWQPVNFGTFGMEEKWGLTPPATTTVLSTMTPVATEGQTPSLLRPESPLTAANIMFTVWLAGFAIALSVLVGGIIRLAWLVFRATPITSELWIRVTKDTSRVLKLTRPIQILHHPRSSTLGTWGILRGRILVPRDAESWPEERVRIVLAHELAHIKRFDWIMQIIAESARAIHWFNPLFWIACKRLRHESEHSCDDAVLNLGIDGQTYAAHLLELARAFKNSDRAWSPVLAMAQPPHLERRFVAMLNPSLNRRPVGLATVGAVVLVAICLTLPLAAMQSREQAAPVVQPRVVTKSSPPAPTSSAANAAANVVPKARVVAAAVRPRPAASPVRATVQEGAGSIFGTVLDATGARIPGAIAGLSFLETKGHQEVASSESGTFEFAKLLPGRYLLQIHLPGFQAFARMVEIQGSERSQQTVTLAIGTISQRVEVSVAGTPKPAPNPAVSTRIRIGGNIQAANLISQVKPIYPESARNAGVEGTVRMQGLIGSDGRILSLQVLNEGQVDIELANAARGAASQWRYRPTLLNGVPVEVFTTIEVDFKLAQ
jgi:TonB family protein